MKLTQKQRREIQALLVAALPGCLSHVNARDAARAQALIDQHNQTEAIASDAEGEV